MSNTIDPRRSDYNGIEAARQQSAVSTGHDLTHPNTMVIISNPAELAYVQVWCDMQRVLPGWIGEREQYPIAISPNGGGWTNLMDRALYYVTFIDFVSGSSR